MILPLALLFLLNIAFVVALWHLDINHNLDRLGESKTRGVLKVSPQQAYRISQYALLTTLLLIDILFLLIY